MSGRAPHPLVRLLPSLTDLAFLLPLALLLRDPDGLRVLLRDGDTGWHLRAGDWMLNNGRVPQTDLFSFTRSGEPWFAWEWLWDVAFAWLHRSWGMGAVVLVNLLVLSLTAALLFRLVRRLCGQGLAAMAITFLAVAASSVHWLARPHLFTLLFVVVWMDVLERAREGRVRLLWLLPALTVVWVNLHGGFVVGAALAMAYGIGEGVTGRGKPYLATAAGCLLTSLINPYGWHLHAHIFRYLADRGYTAQVDEFQSISFHAATSRFFEVLLLAGVAAAVWNVSRRRYTHVLLLLGWGHLALLAARNIPIFAMIAAPLLAMALAEWGATLPRTGWPAWASRLAEWWRQTAQNVDVVDRLPRAYAVSVASVVLVGFLLSARQAPAAFRPEYDPHQFPVRAVEMLLQAQPAESLFTNDEWGDYLIYRLFPSTKVFVDSRTDFYGPQFVRDYLHLMAVRPGWDAHLARYGVRLVLLPPGTPLAGVLKESPRWRAVYDDGVAVLFRAVGDAEGQRVSGGNPRVPAPESAGPRAVKNNTRS